MCASVHLRCLFAHVLKCVRKRDVHVAQSAIAQTETINHIAIVSHSALLRLPWAAALGRITQHFTCLPVFLSSCLPVFLSSSLPAGCSLHSETYRWKNGNANYWFETGEVTGVCVHCARGSPGGRRGRKKVLGQDNPYDTECVPESLRRPCQRQSKVSLTGTVRENVIKLHPFMT